MFHAIATLSNLHLLTQCLLLRSHVSIAFYGIKRPVHIILSVQIVYHRVRHPKYGEMRLAILTGWVTLRINFRLKGYCLR